MKMLMLTLACTTLIVQHASGSFMAQQGASGSFRQQAASGSLRQQAASALKNGTVPSHLRLDTDVTKAQKKEIRGAKNRNLSKERDDGRKRQRFLNNMSTQEIKQNERQMWSRNQRKDTLKIGQSVDLNRRKHQVQSQINNYEKRNGLGSNRPLNPGNVREPHVQPKASQYDSAMNAQDFQRYKEQLFETMRKEEKNTIAKLEDGIRKRFKEEIKWYQEKLLKPYRDEIEWYQENYAEILKNCTSAQQKYQEALNESNVKTATFNKILEDKNTRIDTLIAQLKSLTDEIKKANTAKEDTKSLQILGKWKNTIELMRNDKKLEKAIQSNKNISSKLESLEDDYTSVEKELEEVKKANETTNKELDKLRATREELKSVNNQLQTTTKRQMYQLKTLTKANETSKASIINEGKRKLKERTETMIKRIGVEYMKCVLTKLADNVKQSRYGGIEHGNEAKYEERKADEVLGMLKDAGYNQVTPTELLDYFRKHAPIYRSKKVRDRAECTGHNGPLIKHKLWTVCETVERGTGASACAAAKP